MRSKLSLFLTVMITMSAVIALSAPVPAAELAGVELDDNVAVGDHNLVLNGLGLRKKAIFKVYVGGLYLPQKSSDPETIQSSDGAWKVVMHFVRSVGKDSLCGGWDDGLANNTPKAGSDVKKDFKQLCDWMEDVKTNDQLTFTYIPGQGTEVTVKGNTKGTLESADSAAALLACWIGPEPPSDDFKSGLLGN